MTRDEYQLLCMKPVYENYQGCNGNCYRHVYLVAQSNKMDLSILSSNVHQSTEVSEIRWSTYNDGITLIREYHKEKRKALRYLFGQIRNIIINGREEVVSIPE